MKKEIGIIVGALVIILVGAYFLNSGGTSNNGEYDGFAQCIKASGATFYGAFWCPHCKAEKALFGDAVKYLPYVECSEPDGQTQTPICIKEGIQSYPTWFFANGTQESGTLSLQELSLKTGCALPAGDDAATTSDVGGQTIVGSSTVTASTSLSI